MLRGMHLRDGAATVSVRQVQECIRSRAVAGRRRAYDLALIKIDGSGIEIGNSAVAVWYRRKFQIVAALFRSTTELVTAIDNAHVVNLGPGIAAIRGFPDALIEIVCIHVPDIHF